MTGNPATGAPPLITAVSRPWWDALARETVAMQHCASCGHWVFYPRSFCPRCGGRALAWEPVDPAATLESWSVAEVPVSPHFVFLQRPILAVVSLGNGVRLPTTLVQVAPEAVRIGMALSPVFDHAQYANATLLRYQPSGAHDLLHRTAASGTSPGNETGSIGSPGQSSGTEGSGSA